MTQCLTRKQVRRLDAIAIDELGIPGVVLMENAGRGAAEIIRQLMGARGLRRALIFCGAGNNGGDGFVIARHLFNAGLEVAVRLAVNEDAFRGDALVNYRILRNMGVAVASVAEDPTEGAQAISSPTPAATQAQHLACRVLTEALSDLRPDDFVVDALLGTGFQGRVREPLAGLIAAINPEKKRLVVAIDVPSGLDCDTGRPGGVAIRADQTITFVAPKVGFSRPGALQWTGDLHVVGIGTPPWLIDRVQREVL